MSKRYRVRFRLDRVCHVALAPCCLTAVSSACNAFQRPAGSNLPRTFENRPGFIHDLHQDRPSGPTGPTTVRRQGNDSKSGQLELQVDPREVSVFVDGVLQKGANGESELTLPVGRHNLRFERQGYAGLQVSNVQVVPGKNPKLRGHLSPP